MVKQFSISQLIIVAVVIPLVAKTQNVLSPKWQQSQTTSTICRKLPRNKKKRQLTQYGNQFMMNMQN